MLDYQRNNCQIIFSRYLQEALDHFSACFGIRIAFFNTLGQELKVGLQQSACEYCRKVRGELGLVERCLQSDRDRMAEAEKCRRSVNFRCHAGLREVVKPVYLDDLLIGYIMMGQIRNSDMPSNTILEQWIKAGGLEADLKKSFLAVPYIEPAKIEHIVGIFEALVENTVARNAYKLENEEPMFRLKNYLLLHIDRNVPLAEAAAFLNWSKSKLTHTMKLKAGLSFKKMQLEMKVAYAEQLIGEYGVNVAEAGYAVGFHDPGYFSRIYKKYRGKPPVSIKKQRGDDC